MEKNTDDKFDLIDAIYLGRLGLWLGLCFLALPIGWGLVYLLPNEGARPVLGFAILIVFPWVFVPFATFMSAYDWRKIAVSLMKKTPEEKRSLFRVVKDK